MTKSNTSLLIVEDDDRLAASLAREFRERGYRVTIARNAGEVSAARARESFGFAIVDLRLGADSGLELVAELRAAIPAMRILVLTGYGSIPTAVEAIRRGANHYMTKPAKIEAIESFFRGDEAVTNRGAETLAEHERSFIDAVLLQEGGNISRAAKRLGIHRQSLQRKLKKFT